MLRTYSSWSRLGPRSWLPLRRLLGRMDVTRFHHLTLRLELLALAVLLELVSSLAVLALLLADRSKGAGSSGTTEDSDEPPVGKSLLRAESMSGSSGNGGGATPPAAAACAGVVRRRDGGHGACGDVCRASESSVRAAVGAGRTPPPAFPVLVFAGWRPKESEAVNTRKSAVGLVWEGTFR